MRLNASILVTALFAPVLTSCTARQIGASTNARAQVLALEEAYRRAWLANDSSAVMATLDRGAVLMPAGANPLVGDSAIRAYWWPADGSRSTITGYDIRVDEVDVTDHLAYLRGRSKLLFIYRDPAGSVSRVQSEAVHLSVARRDARGEWRIARRAWSSVSSTPPPGQSTASDDSTTIAALIEQVEAANNRGDVEQWVSLFDSDFVYMAPGALPVTTLDALRDVARAGFRNKAAIDIRPLEIVVHGPWAFARTHVTGNVTLHDSGRSVQVDTKQIVIYRQNAQGAWRIARLISNSNR
ncbi:MAG TPA: nuclear transport factor 2 family protein [Gemmatimonadaceae bacterium]